LPSVEKSYTNTIVSASTPAMNARFLTDQEDVCLQLYECSRTPYG